MKTKVLRVPMLIVCAFVAGHAAAADKAASSAQVAKAMASKPFVEAVQILAEQDEEINPKTARVVVVPGKPDVITLHFDITRRGSKELGEFKRLVYVEYPNKPVVYFDGKTGRTAAMAITGVNICYDPSPWTTAPLACLGGSCLQGKCDRQNITTRTCRNIVGGGRRTEFKYAAPTLCGCTPAQCAHIADPGSNPREVKQ